MRLNETEDPRKTGLKNGLKQLNREQLLNLWEYEGPMMLDTYNYQDGVYCPLAIGVGLHKAMKNPTHERVQVVLELMGYKVNNTRGIKGKFYTKNRAHDLRVAMIEVMYELGVSFNSRWR